MLDYYRILGLAPNASQEDIKKAYRALAIHYHPDHNPGDPQGASERFQLIREAYEVLGEPSVRVQYDAAVRAELEKLLSQMRAQEEQNRKAEKASASSQYKDQQPSDSKSRTATSPKKSEQSSEKEILTVFGWILGIVIFAVLLGWAVTAGLDDSSRD